MLAAIQTALDALQAQCSIEHRGALSRALLATSSPAVLARHLELLTVQRDPKLLQQLRVLFVMRGATALPFLTDRAATASSVTERIELLTIVGQLHGAAAVPLARTGVDAAEPELRSRGARVLGWLGTAADGPLIERLRDDPDPGVRGTATVALAHHAARVRGEAPLPPSPFCEACLGPNPQLGIIATGRKFVPDDAPADRRVPVPPRIRPPRALRCADCGHRQILSQPELTDGGSGSFAEIWTPRDDAAVQQALRGILAGTLDPAPLRAWFHGDYGISGPPTDLFVHGTGEVQLPTRSRETPLRTRFVVGGAIQRVVAYLLEQEAWRSRSASEGPPVIDGWHLHLEIGYRDDATRIDASSPEDEALAAVQALGDGLTRLVG